MSKSYEIPNDNRLFYAGLALSFGLHVMGAAVLGNHKTSFLVKKANNIEVTYQSIKVKTLSQKAASIEKMRVVQTPPFVKDLDILDKKAEFSSSAGQKIQDISKLPEKLYLSKKIVPKIQTMEGERRITIPEFESEKITNPQYLSYNQSIRERIKERAYQYINHPDFKAGSVYLTFILKSDGTLKDIKVIEEKTSANDYLRAIGIRSIKESTPFTPFPANLNFPELTFNVVMSFEMK